jgi:excinuclease ABC subunit B
LDYATGAGNEGQLELAAESVGDYATTGDTEQLIRRLEVEMKAAAKKLEFERAAELRNRIRTLRLKALELAQ